MPVTLPCSSTPQTTYPPKVFRKPQTTGPMAPALLQLDKNSIFCPSPRDSISRITGTPASRWLRVVSFELKGPPTNEYGSFDAENSSFCFFHFISVLPHGFPFSLLRSANPNSLYPSSTPTSCSLLDPDREISAPLWICATHRCTNLWLCRVAERAGISPRPRIPLIPHPPTASRSPPGRGAGSGVPGAVP